MSYHEKITTGLISKRLTCLNSQLILRESQDKSVQEMTEKIHIENSLKYLKDLRSVIESSNISNIKNMANRYIQSMTNLESAESQWFDLLDVASVLSENENTRVIAEQLIYEYTTRILPYTPNEKLNDIRLAIEYKDITLPDDLSNKLLEFVTMYEDADTIIFNHDNLSKRYNMESLVNKYKSLGMKYFIDSCILRVNTYSNINQYDKMGVVLQEATYLLEKNNCKYDPKELLETTLNSFLLEEHLSGTDINCMLDAIYSSAVISEENINDVITQDPNNNESISNIIAQFYKYPDKNIDTLLDSVNRICSNASKLDIMGNFDKLLLFLWDIAKSDIISNIKMYSVFGILKKFIESRSTLEPKIIEDDRNFDKENLIDLMKSIDRVKTLVETYGTSDVEYKTISNEFISQGLDYLKDSIYEVERVLYPTDNINNIQDISNNDILSLARFESTGCSNLINGAIKFNEFLSIREARDKSTFKDVSSIGTSIMESVDNMRKNIYAYISENGIADIVIRQYMSTNEDNESLIKFAESSCTLFNDINSGNTIKAYYITLEGAIEIHLKDKRIIEMDEVEVGAVAEAGSPDTNFYIGILENALDQAASFDNNILYLEDYLTDLSKLKNFDKEGFDLALECLKYIDTDSSLVNLFAERFNEYQFNTLLTEGHQISMYTSLVGQEKVVNESVRNWESKKYNNVPYDIQVEAASYLVSLLEGYADDWDDINVDDDDEEDDEKKEDKKSEKEQDKENEDKLRKDPKYNKDAKDTKDWKPARSTSKISLNKLKLGILGLHNKFKEMSNKEKELSRNLDNSVRAMVKSMKGLFVSDRREAIIKGSLIPSFSKCIKGGIALAGLGVATQSIVVPAIVAIGGIALSKVLTHKERLLLLDDIETELDVVEKELAIAESNNKMNQYRALLQYKKNLQRQYQRIRYNIRVGKDILPGSATGVPTSNR